MMKLIVGIVLYVLFSPGCFAGCIILAKLFHEMGACTMIVDGTCCLSVLFAPGMFVYGFVGAMI